MTEAGTTDQPGTLAQIGPVGEFLRNQGIDESVATLIGDVITLVVVFVLVYVVGRLLLLPFAERLMDRRELDAHARRPLTKLLMALVVFGAVAAAFGAAGYRDFLTSLATIGAAATLAVGFALQDVLKNFVAGVFIFTDRPFRIGDWIEWDDYTGTVQDISLRVTRVRTFDNELLTVPNSTLTESVIKNPVANDRLRLTFDFGIGYDDDVERAMDIIVQTAKNQERILDDPAPSVRLTELGDDAVGLQARFWIDDPNRSDVVGIRGDLVTEVKRQFDEVGIDLPYPQRVLHGGLTMHGDAEATASRAADE